MTNLEALRVNARLSVEELAAAAGVAKGTILDAEREIRKPRVETLGKLADYFTERLGRSIEPATLLMQFAPAPGTEAAA